MGNRQLEALLECGFCRIEQILDRPFIDRLQRAADAILEAQTEEERQRRMAQGSMVRTTHMEDPVFGELIVWPRTLEVLAEMGFTQPTFTDGYIISKPAHSPALFWHYDWFAWGDPSAYEAKPPQVALMYYISIPHPQTDVCG